MFFFSPFSFLVLVRMTWCASADAHLILVLLLRAPCGKGVAFSIEEDSVL